MFHPSPSIAVCARASSRELALARWTFERTCACRASAGTGIDGERGCFPQRLRMPPAKPRSPLDCCHACLLAAFGPHNTTHLSTRLSTERLDKEAPAKLLEQQVTTAPATSDPRGNSRDTSGVDPAPSKIGMKATEPAGTVAEESSPVERPSISDNPFMRRDNLSGVDLAPTFQTPAQRMKMEAATMNALAEAETQRKMLEEAKIKAAAEAEAVVAAKLKAAAEAEAQQAMAKTEATAEVEAVVAAEIKAEAEAQRTAEMEAQAHREAGELAKREVEERERREAEELEERGEREELEAEEQAQRQREVKDKQKSSKALFAALAAPPPPHQAKRSSSSSSSSSSSLPGYEGAAQHAKEQGWAQGAWKGAGSKVTLATRAVGAFGAASTKSRNTTPP